MYQVGIITASDKGSKGQREDLSGPAIEKILGEFSRFSVKKYVLIPDEQLLLQKTMCEMADELNIHLILTTGGTGFSKRDVTPEATLAVIQRHVPGIPEAMRAISFKITPRAMLSRAQAGIRGNTLIVNLPGSPKAIAEVLIEILPSIEHGLDVLMGSSVECAQDQKK